MTSTPTTAASRRPRGHLALLIALFVLFAISPLVVTVRFGVVFMSIIAAAVLLSATYAVSEKGRLFSLTVVVSILTALSSVAILIFDRGWTVLVSHSCTVLLLLLFTISVLRRVLAPGGVTADRIYASICVYLLAGYAFAFLYSIAEQLQPGSFRGLAEGADAHYIERVMQLKYFSFVTLTTVGYGDISPVSPLACTLANLEAISGQFYLAVLVARLVGLHIVHATESRD